jgi:hypothetical protein
VTKNGSTLTVFVSQRKASRQMPVDENGLAVSSAASLAISMNFSFVSPPIAATAMIDRSCHQFNA